MDEGNAFFGRATFEKIIFPGQTVSLLLNLVSLRWSFLDRKKKGGGDPTGDRIFGSSVQIGSLPSIY